MEPFAPLNPGTEIFYIGNFLYPKVVLDKHTLFTAAYTSILSLVDSKTIPVVISIISRCGSVKEYHSKEEYELILERSIEQEKNGYLVADDLRELLLKDEHFVNRENAHVEISNIVLLCFLMGRWRLHVSQNVASRTIAQSVDGEKLYCALEKLVVNIYTTCSKNFEKTKEILVYIEQYFMTLSRSMLELQSSLIDITQTVEFKKLVRNKYPQLTDRCFELYSEFVHVIDNSPMPPNNYEIKFEI